MLALCLCESSIFLRSFATCMSTVRVNIELFEFHTLRNIWSRVTTCWRLSMKNFMSLNSSGEKSSRHSPLLASSILKSSRTSPNSTNAAGSDFGVDRRSTASTRACNSMKLNGFVT